MTSQQDAPDLILFNGLFTTLDKSKPTATAVAIRDGKFIAVGSDSEVSQLKSDSTRTVDLKGRSALPGLIDNHLHIIRGGLNFNMELRWDGVRSLATAMDMLKAQVAITPPPQWVRVVGGFTEHQFDERRLPTIEELNAAAPDTPVFMLHLYDRALLNAAALRVVGYTKETPEPPGGEIVRDSAGNPTGLLLAKPNAAILYATLAKGPKLPPEYQLNSTRHFMRELNRLGVTGAIDAGGGFQNFPEDYEVVKKLDAEGLLTIRLAYNLFTQKPKGEKEDFLNWTKTSKYKDGNDYFRHNGAGEMLTFSAADFEDFRVPRPDMPPEMEGDLEGVVRVLVENRWPWRMHATYDETISRALDVFEKVNRDIPLAGLNWFFDHAETITEKSMDRIAALGGGIAVQHRMAYQGEYFVERYGGKAAEGTPPVARMLEKGIHTSAGTDATRVASYNPWVSLSWLAVCAFIPVVTVWTVRRPCACGPRRSPGSRTKSARKGRLQWVSSRTLLSLTATSLPAPRTTSLALRLCSRWWAARWCMRLANSPPWTTVCRLQRCQTGHRCESMAGLPPGSRATPPVLHCSRLRPLHVTARALVGYTGTTMAALGSAMRRHLTTRAFGERWDARAGRSRAGSSAGQSILGRDATASTVGNATVPHLSRLSVPHWRRHQVVAFRRCRR
jgi:predicted amidohydrolase YtcJ